MIYILLLLDVLLTLQNQDAESQEILPPLISLGPKRRLR